MSKLDFSELICQIKAIEHKFNLSTSPTERYALLQAINHIADFQLRFADDHWLIEQYRHAMLREQGIRTNK
jgi:chloramphenicol O-acetyltransferase